MLRVKLARRVTPLVTMAWLASCVASMAQMINGVPPNTGNTSNTGSTNSTGGNGSGSTRPPASSPPDSSKPAFLSGRVLVSDGNFPMEGVTVQRLCGVSITAETHTDSKGRFSMQLGGGMSRAVVTDVSSGAVSRGNDSSGAGGGRGTSDASAWGCDLRAVLQGYRSDTISLGNRHAMDDPNIGTILLHPLTKKGQGLTVSGTSALAPKSARQAYEKGLSEMRHNQPEKAQKNFTRAVDEYPRFALAWFELGQTYERRAHTADARDAYAKAIAADANYVNPYERLYMLDLMDGKWQQAADRSEKVLRLDPINFSRAYYFNALANAHLQNLTAAEKSAREATKLEGPAAEPRAHYILGMVLASKGNFTAAAESLRTFLKTAMESPEQKVANRVLAMIEDREAGKQTPAAH